MKLIIDIPEEDFEWIQTHKSVTDYQITQMLYKRVMNGAPFDSVIDDIKAEMKELKGIFPTSKYIAIINKHCGKEN